MRIPAHYYIVLTASLALGIASCSNVETTTTTTTTTTVTAANASAWQNPRKGKIWDKENFVQIPLTAAESELRGAVKTVGFRNYEIENGNEGKKALSDSGSNTYDQAGHLVEQIRYDADKTPVWICKYQYDGQRPVKWDLRLFEEQANSHITFRFDGAGNKVEETTVDSNKEYCARTAYKYDDKGRQIEAAVYDDRNELSRVTSYAYDNRGFQVTYTSKGADGVVDNKMTCIYDDKGNKVSGESYSSDTTLDGRWVQKNDSLGRRVETDFMDARGILQEKRMIKYDDHGFDVEHNTYSPNGKLDEEKSYSYKNEYDKTGNIIRQTEIRWKDGKQIPVNYSEYAISYY